MNHQEAIALTITILIVMFVISISLVLAGTTSIEKPTILTDSATGDEGMKHKKKSKGKKSDSYPLTQNSTDSTTEIINNAVINSGMYDTGSTDCGTMSDYGSGGDFGTYG